MQTIAIPTDTVQDDNEDVSQDEELEEKEEGKEEEKEEKETEEEEEVECTLSEDEIQEEVCLSYHGSIIEEF